VSIASRAAFGGAVVDGAVVAGTAAVVVGAAEVVGGAALVVGAPPVVDAVAPSPDEEHAVAARSRPAAASVVVTRTATPAGPRPRRLAAGGTLVEWLTGAGELAEMVMGGL
jgi:hypothetical protein